MLTSYGRSSGFCVDPVEKKPLEPLPARFGGAVASAPRAATSRASSARTGTSRSRGRSTRLSGRGLARGASPGPPTNWAAAVWRSPTTTRRSSGSTLSDVADACHDARPQGGRGDRGLHVCPSPRREFYRHDRRGQRRPEGVHRGLLLHQICVGPSAPVLDTLVYLRHETDVWLEITTLLIPGHNDSDAEIDAMRAGSPTDLGADVPLHFTAFHPDYKMTDIPPTPPATLTSGPAESGWPKACGSSTPAMCTTATATPRTVPGCGAPWWFATGMRCGTTA